MSSCAHRNLILGASEEALRKREALEREALAAQKRKLSVKESIKKIEEDSEYAKRVACYLKYTLSKKECKAIQKKRKGLASSDPNSDDAKNYVAAEAELPHKFHNSKSSYQKGKKLNRKKWRKH